MGWNRSKALIPVTFTYPSDKSSTPSTSTSSTPICPSCSKEMSNSTRCVLLTSRTPASAVPAAKKQKGDKLKDKEKEKEPYCCGHVICGTCADTIVKPGKQCVVCEAVIRPEKDMIELGKEGEW